MQSGMVYSKNIDSSMSLCPYIGEGAVIHDVKKENRISGISRDLQDLTEEELEKVLDFCKSVLKCRA